MFFFLILLNIFNTTQRFNLVVLVFSNENFLIFNLYRNYYNLLALLLMLCNEINFKLLIVYNPCFLHIFKWIFFNFHVVLCPKNTIKKQTLFTIFKNMYMSIINNSYTYFDTFQNFKIKETLFTSYSQTICY